MNEQIQLMHPLHSVPATADIVGKLFKAGRWCGLVLQLPDGHRCELTFKEIRELGIAEEAEAVL